MTTTVTRRTIQLSDGYCVEILLDSDGDVCVTAKHESGWSYQPGRWFEDSHKYWPLKKAHKAIALAMKAIVHQRRAVDRFTNEVVPAFEVLVEVEQAIADS